MIDQSEIVAAIAENLGLAPADIDRHALLQEDLNLGPVELSDLLSNLSSRFQIHFDPEELEGIRTVDDLIVLVEDSLL